MNNHVYLLSETNEASGNGGPHNIHIIKSTNRVIIVPSEHSVVHNSIYSRVQKKEVKSPCYLRGKVKPNNDRSYQLYNDRL